MSYTPTPEILIKLGFRITAHTPRVIIYENKHGQCIDLQYSSYPGVTQIGFAGVSDKSGQVNIKLPSETFFIELLLALGYTLPATP
jgi:hypothetical protein